jgi:O-antigen ligase
MKHINQQIQVNILKVWRKVMFNFKASNGILVMATILIFANLTIYLPFVNLFPFPAYLLDLAIFVFIVLFYMKGNINIPYKNIFIIWIVYYTILNLVYFMASPATEAEFTYFKIFIFFVLMLLSFILLFNLDDENLTVSRKTIVFMAPFAVLMLGMDYFNPQYFYFGKEVLSYVVGRAASTYINSNIAGGAMVLLLIFGIDMVPKKFRLLFVALLFLGVFFTMSRSNIMIFSILVLVLLLQKKLHVLQFLTISITVIFFFLWLSMGGFDVLEDRFNLEVTEDMKNRVEFFVDNKSSDIGDTNERQEVLASAFDMYMTNPIFGSGYASTRLWDYQVSPHNTLVMHWADYGLFGLLLIPLMFLFATLNIFKFGKSDHKKLAISIMLYFTLSSFFSHNMLEQPLQIASIVMLSVIGYKAKKRFYEENYFKEKQQG